ncbi:MAG: Ig-like domain-containing protein [Limisphaerales bacterium]
MNRIEAHFAGISRWLRVCALAFAFLGWSASIVAAAPNIVGIEVTPAQDVRVQHATEAGYYYVLYRGPTPNTIFIPVDLWGITDNRGYLRELNPILREGYYRVRQIPLGSPADTDGDGFDDVYEVDAGSDPLRPGGPDFTTYSVSPQNGEIGVAVTRETVIRFSRPLAASTMLTTTNLYAGYAGRKLLSRVELSSDRRTATLFYLEQLPGGTRVYGVFDGTGITDESGREIDADDDGRVGGVGLFSFETLSTVSVHGTAVIGQVFASEQEVMNGITNDVPLANVTITVDGAEETIRATTDAEGRFTLTNAPSGRFFVHVDGRTVTQGIANSELRWDQRDYYPVVGKAWETVPGVATNLAGGTGEIYLPLIRSGTLQSVSATAPTAITFPASVLAEQPNLAGVQIIVPPNALLSENGSRGGSVGIAPVPSDRLPEALPPGLNLPMVITIQTDGPLNFDQPVPVRFPNLPDPITGLKLAPGEKSALWSFNHDTGNWEIVGPMTVSEDGNFVVTDPGVGVLQPGWHGTQPGVGAGGGPLTGPPCKPHGSGRNCRQNPDFQPDNPANYNGCGPDGWDYLVPDNPNGNCASFFPACRNHDIGYNTCGKPQKETDDQFLLDMIAACGCITDLVDYAECLLLATAYHAAVSSGGEDAWGVAQGKACICEENPDCPTSSGGGPGSGGGGGPGNNSLAQNLLRQASPGAGIPASYVPQVGPHHFVVIDAATQEVVQRGRAGTLGIAFTQLILQPNRVYDIGILQDATMWEGHIRIITGPSGSRLEIPPIIVRPPASWDFDSDGLHDVGEMIMGTNQHDPDSDDDGISDATEVQLGLNPLGESQIATGVIAAADTPGTAVDVSALNNFVAVADSNTGVSIFDVSSPNPVLLAQVDTPGVAQRVAWDGIYLAVADGSAGLAIINARVVEDASIIHQVPLGNVTAIRAAANLAYAGLSSGEIIMVEMTTGAILRTLRLNGPVADLAFGGDYLYALTSTHLFAIDIRGGELSALGSAPSPIISTPNSGLTIGGGIAYAVHGRGANTFTLLNPEQPALLSPGNTAQFGWEHIVPNGTGLGMAAVGTAFAFDQQRVFSLYNLTDTNQSPVFITSYQHPGHARAVSIYNGLAYGAAHDAGLLVINYLAFDTLKVPPTISLEGDFPLAPAQAEEGKIVRITANVTDDVQVRNVHFFVDDVLVAIDGNYPFEHRFITPQRAATNKFTIRAVAFDTGGNRAETALITVDLVPDATPPRIIGRFPVRGSFVGATETIGAFFNEPINPATITPTAFTLLFAGEDEVFGSTDDTLIAGGSVDYRSEGKAAFLNLGEGLAPGLYRARIAATVSDVTGNAMGADSTWDFLVLGFVDNDQDGVPDNVETLLGFDPTKRDSNSNGVADGDEDLDGDGLRTSWELAFGYNPAIRDSDSNGVEDQNEDPDFDALSNLAEQAAVTHPRVADTDADGWPDESEVTAGSNPLDAASKPRLVSFVAPPPATVIAPGLPAGDVSLGTMVATPPIMLTLPSAGDIGDGGFAVANPQVQITLPQAPQLDGAEIGTTIEQPVVTAVLPAFGADLESHWGFSVGTPPVIITLPTMTGGTNFLEGTTIALPPVTVDFADE